jgi:tetratricopeptide (TPR) repeat protein
MAKDKQAEQAEASSVPLDPHLVTPAHRQRLQKCYEHGMKLSTQEKKPDYDYAHTLFSECVSQDPANLVYVEAMLDNLQRKYGGNKKGARLGGIGGARSALKKAAAKEDWKEVLSLGPEALKQNPWDVPTLRSLARACAAHHYNEAELRYLKNALEANPKDVDVNRHCAESLARMGQFDQAIACWSRVEEFGKVNDQAEAQEKISELTIERARGRSGLPGEAKPLPKAPVKEVARMREADGGVSREATEEDPTVGKEAAKSPKSAESTEMSTEENERGEIIDSPEAAASVSGDDFDDQFRRSLEKAIAENPADAGSYVLLADLLVDHGRFDHAEDLLKRALFTTGRNLSVIERTEDLQIERAAHQVAVAEKRLAKAGESEEAQGLVIELKKELNRIELEVFRQRADRYPDDGEVKYELGLRLKRAGNQEEAIRCFGEIGDRSSSAPAAALEMGESLQYLKHFRDALDAYERAARLAGENDPHHRKKALYRGGVLATGMRKLDKAESLLRELEQLDPDYKDLSHRLDKIQKIRDSV